jgi:ABC-type sugar transport system permease subunit
LPQLLTQARALRTLPGFTSDVEIYHGTAPLVDATAVPLSPDDLTALDSAARGLWRDGAAVVPLRDHDAREVVGAVAVRPRPVPRGPLPGGIGFALPVAVIALATATTIALRRMPLRRGGYALIALALGVAAYVDVRGAARQSTDRWLTDTRRLLQEAATRLPPPRTRVAVNDLAALVPDAELVAGEPGEFAARRVRVDGQRRAVVAVLIGQQRWVELRTTPDEDATLPWLVVLLACAFLGPMAIWLVRWADRTPVRQRRETAIAWGFLAPAGVHLLIFSVGPLLYALYLALHPPTRLVGFANFSTVLREPATWNALRNTAVYSLYVPVSVALALALALFVRGCRNRWGARLIHSALVLPAISSVVATALLWQLVYQSGSLIRGGSNWLTSPATALVALMLVALWAQVGAQAMVFLTGLDRIPAAYLDAARVDGASAWQRFWRITFPLLRPLTLFVLVSSVLGAFQMFTFVYVLTGGGPGPAYPTDVVVHRIYQMAIGPQGVGIAVAFGFLLMLVLLPLTWGQLRLLRSPVQRA